MKISKMLAMTLGLSLLVALAATADAAPKKKKPTPTPTPTSSVTHVKTVSLRGISTNPAGEIMHVITSNSEGMMTYKGCGAKLVNHPHLIKAYEQGVRLDLRVENDCITLYTVAS